MRFFRKMQLCLLLKASDMEKKKFIGLGEDDLLKIEQIVIDRDKEGALDFIKQVVKKQIDRENALKMKRKGI